MLNKSICQKCNKDYYIKNRSFTKEEAKWDLSQEFLWIKGKIFCPYKYDNGKTYNNGEVNIKNNPPKQCPFYLEQILSNKINEIK